MNGTEKKKSILIVEDNGSLRLALKVAFEGTGLEAAVAADGNGALDAVERKTPDLILLDLFIPEPDGFQVLSHLRADRRTHEVPVIIFSVLSQPEDKARAMALGANDYFVKSEMSIADVVARVVKLL
ncbi:MAG TPA: response regulator [Candidatus Binatia bacterium]|jgi:two-component system sensor histidine kinase/response regulator|nr:response regulator [Candidatus Binatia bacterium]